MNSRNKENDKYCQITIEKFEEANKDFLGNKLISSFLNDPQHRQAYYRAICKPTEENKQELDSLFKAFYFAVRFTSHISSTLHFNAINYDKRSRKINDRYMLTLDSNVNSDDGETTFKDLLVNKSEPFLEGSNFLDQIKCPVLYKAIQLLSDKQYEIIRLVYFHGLTDTEISKMLNKSQQAVSKTHKKALKVLYAYLCKERRA
ncbi:MAG: sigma-70 family RNA polymerase sigma factor [Lysinibacillus sp.]